MADGNIGSIMGIGAPAWTGGLLQFVNTYGLQNFIDRCGELSDAYGDRFAAPPSLLRSSLREKLRLIDVGLIGGRAAAFLG